jgi:hypothetical protein
VPEETGCKVSQGGWPIGNLVNDHTMGFITVCTKGFPFLDEPVLDITLARTVIKCTMRKTRKQTRNHQARQQTQTPTVLTAAHTMICGPDKTPQS